VRLVLDTNTTISALLWHGTPSKLIDAAQSKTLFLFTSAPLLAELRGARLREKFAGQLKARSLSPAEIAAGYAALTLPTRTSVHLHPLWRAIIKAEGRSKKAEASAASLAACAISLSRTDRGTCGRGDADDPAAMICSSVPVPAGIDSRFLLFTSAPETIGGIA